MKVHGGPFQSAGIPDLIGCTGGLFFAFEVKTPSGETSALQEEIMRRIRREGGAVAAVVTTPGQAVTLVKYHLAKARRLPTGMRGVRR
jgi:Holliday junction resolvase